MSTKVIIVGGGLSGLSAAHTVLERGGNVLLLDKNSFMGGNSTKATSGINGANTQPGFLFLLGHASDRPISFADTKKSARDLARDDLIKVLTYKSGDAVNWLVERFNLDLSKVSRLGGHSEKRTHRGGQQFPGMTITYALMEKLEDLTESQPDRVKIVKKAKVTKLIQEGGKIVGVEYEREGQKHTEHGTVVLATGGYAADFTSDSLLKKHRPEYYDLPTTNGDHCTGDGHKMAMAVGAKGIDLEKVQVHPTGLVDPKEPDAKVKFLAAEALRGVGGILLDNTGNRFVDELQHRDYVTGKMWENNKFPVRLVLNGQSSKEIEWHCKHYVGRGLMKRFNSGEELAKEMGVKPEVLQKTFDDHNKYAKNPGTDPFGKKFFSGGDFKMNDVYHVALMTPVLHYTMGGLEIGTDSAVHDSGNKPIPGLFACGELAGGVHGANRLGGSSLLGCVVFGRVAGDSAASYTLAQLSNERAANRLNTVANHLLETRIRVDPSSKHVNLQFSWADEGSGGTGLTAAGPSSESVPAESKPAKEGDRTLAQVEQEKLPKPEAKKNGEAKGEYTAEEVAKHNKESDCWVIIDGQVLDVTNFLSEHPGGAKAILLYAGRDATEEFNMIHPPNAIPKYAPDTVIGKLKK
ncbi:FAD binding domain-domain-containing protein [Kockovaella imperatae]|uniref:fumarate reductase (NADH) n=1 Tax=Kockovaella imperatae TaxID=4999 RepID=A0A1Y1UL98_9TREE|nr:FAD binding domain-domain-containing protein [Kockovaella imperatae]ORX38823.1 FAD binding domain-domain-containing protein [Kockovaella imperatae]